MVGGKGWQRFVTERQGRGELTEMEGVELLNRRLICQCRHQGYHWYSRGRSGQRGSGDGHWTMGPISPQCFLGEEFDSMAKNVSG